MHFEFLMEDQSSGEAMKILAPKLLLGDGISFRVHTYKGIGHIPKNLKPDNDPKKRLLLSQLPRILSGYGKVPDCGYIVIICDLDDRDREQFLSELYEILEACNPKPKAYFCLSVEEFEAWYLGDIEAVRKAYPLAKGGILNRYVNDSVCGTWEVLADAVYKGGHQALSKKGWQKVGEEKSKWAKAISPHMNVDGNASPSFQSFYSLVRGLV